jgi:dTDP-4-amino-4,6-dideoxygalactose transaminase
LNIDASLVDRAIGPRTRAILPVHLYGRPAPMRALRSLAQGRGLRLIEDCAQSTGAESDAGRTGSVGDAGCFSFYPTKNLGAYGDGGMVVSSDTELVRRARLLRTYGWQERDLSVEPGYNSRLDELQAAILSVKLTHLDAWNRRRVEIAARYDAGFRETVGVVPPAVETGHVWHLYVVRVAERDRVRRSLAERGIGTGVHYPVPLHRQPAYQAFGEGRRFPHTEAASAEILSLPMYPQLLDSEVDRVVGAVKAAVDG